MSNLNRARLSRHPYLDQCPFTYDQLECVCPDCDGCAVLVKLYEKIDREDIKLCPGCGTFAEAEREVFGNDKLWTGHSCRGGEIRC